MAKVGYFSSSAMRDLNKFTLFCNNEPIFTAWVYGNSPFVVNLGLNTPALLNSESLQSLGGNAAQLLTLAGQSGVMQELGLTPSMAGLSFATKNLYRGTKCLQFDVDTYLILKEDYNKDIADPLQTLMDYFAPKKGTCITQKIRSVVSSFNSQAKSKDSAGQANGGAASGDGWSVMQNILEKGIDFLGEVYLLELPKAYSNGTQNRLSVQYGSFYVDEIAIENLSVSIPPPVYSNPDKDNMAMPDNVKVHFTVKTLRPLTTESIDFKLKRR